MESDDRNRLLLDYGWRHFDFHAKQRLSLFNFYIVLCGLIVAAWANIMTSEEPMPEVGFCLGVLLAFFSYLFWRLDQRNAYLTKRSEAVMREAEKRLFGPDECLFCADEIDKALASPRHIFNKQWSHGTSLRVMFCCIGAVGLVGATYSALSGIGTRQSPALAPTAPQTKSGRVPAPKRGEKAPPPPAAPATPPPSAGQR